MGRFLYWLILSLDACFRVKRYDVSSVLKDPIMDDGWAYFVADGPYKEFLKQFKEQTEVRSTLSNCDVVMIRFL